MCQLPRQIAHDRGRPTKDAKSVSQNLSTCQHGTVENTRVAGKKIRLEKMKCRATIVQNRAFEYAEHGIKLFDLGGDAEHGIKLFDLGGDAKPVDYLERVEMKT